MDWMIIASTLINNRYYESMEEFYRERDSTVCWYTHEHINKKTVIEWKIKDKNEKD